MVQKGVSLKTKSNAIPVVGVFLDGRKGNLIIFFGLFREILQAVVITQVYVDGRVGIPGFNTPDHKLPGFFKLLQLLVAGNQPLGIIAAPGMAFYQFLVKNPGLIKFPIVKILLGKEVFLGEDTL